jgi:hypothetical protein
MRALSEHIKFLEPNLTETQVSAIAKRYADRTFRRLIAWAVVSAFAGGASVVLAHFIFRG